MADPSTSLPLIPSSICTAHSKIKPYIHRTPLLTCKTLDRIASSTDPSSYSAQTPSISSPQHREQSNGQNTPSPAGAPVTHTTPPKFNLFFKCENMQKIGAFKARGAHHAIIRLIEERGVEEVRKRGVVTHSSGNHAQALALAASTFSIPSYIVMPSISMPGKIAGTRAYTPNVIFSGSTSDEREAKVVEVVRDTGALLVPPYDHPDIILGQGTLALEMAEQLVDILAQEQQEPEQAPENGARNGKVKQKRQHQQPPHFDAVIAPIGGGGLLGGIATYFSSPPPPPSSPTHNTNKLTLVFGAEPSFQGADDASRGLRAEPPTRITSVKSLTIADGLRTPVGLWNWDVITAPKANGSTIAAGKETPPPARNVEAVYAVSEAQIRAAMRLVLERLKLVVEPSSAVPLAVVLYNAEFREWVAQRQAAEEEGERVDGEERAGWNVGVVLSGGNTSVEAIAQLFAGAEGE